MNKEFFDEFVEKVFNNEHSFEIDVDEGRRYKLNYHFIQDNVGKARYVYGAYGYNKENFYASLKMKYELYAIVSDDVVYIIEDFPFKFHYGEFDIKSLPQNVKLLRPYANEINEHLKNTVFMDFYNNLKTFDIADGENNKWCKEKARNWLFDKKTSPYSVNATAELEEDLINLQQIAESLCGFLNIEDEARKTLQRKEDSWIHTKTTMEQIQRFIDDKSVVSEWELKLADGLHSVDAKTVNVEFEYNGKTDSGKMSPKNILRKLVKIESFSEYDFATAKQGSEIIRNLDVGYYYDLKKGLTCQNIIKITYGKKVLYSKE